MTWHLGVDRAEAIEQGRPRHRDVVEGNPGIVEVIGDGLGAHVAHRHPGRELA
jgi:hypothetical protein